MAKILVTGGAGFIGSHVTDKLVELGHEVIVLDNISTGKRENVNARARLVEKDIRDNLEELFAREKFDYVYHFAAQINVRKALADPQYDAGINIMGGLNIIDLAAKHQVKKFIFASTGGALYAPNEPLPWTEETFREPQSPYGLAKLTIENYLRIYRSIFGLSFVALRFSNVYGPRQNPKGEAGVIAIFSQKALAGESLPVFGDGTQTRDYIYVKDIVDAAIRAMHLDGSYNVSTQVETSVNELISFMKPFVPPMSMHHPGAIAGEVPRCVLSSDKLKKEGWFAHYSIGKGIRETVEWFAKNS